MGRRESGGKRISETREVTIAVKAAPILEVELGVAEGRALM